LGRVLAQLRGDVLLSSPLRQRRPVGRQALLRSRRIAHSAVVENTGFAARRPRATRVRITARWLVRLLRRLLPLLGGLPSGFGALMTALRAGRARGLAR